MDPPGAINRPEQMNDEKRMVSEKMYTAEILTQGKDERKDSRNAQE